MDSARSPKRSPTAVDQLQHLGVIGGGEGQQADFFEAGLVHGGLDGFQDFVHRSLPHRAGDHPRLAEAAAAGAAAHDLDRDPVVDGVDVGHDQVGGGRRQLADDALDHRQRGVFVQPLNIGEHAVLIVIGFVELRDIHAPDLAQSFQKLLARLPRWISMTGRPG